MMAVSTTGGTKSALVLEVAVDRPWTRAIPKSIASPTRTRPTAEGDQRLIAPLRRAGNLPPRTNHRRPEMDGSHEVEADSPGEARAG
jgi:hypothetical protein